MKTISELLRASILSKMPRAGLMHIHALRITEWCHEFEKLMRDRLLMGAIRYGAMSIKRKPGHTAMIIDYIQAKLNEYKDTGNTEMLVDIANLAMVEFVHSDHPNKHFKTIDREE